MVGSSGGLGSTILNSLSQQVYQKFQKEDSNRSGGLDTDEIQKKIDATGSGQDLVDNFSSIDADQNGELSPAELVVFRTKAGAGQGELFDQLQTIFEQSGISTNSIADFLSNGANGDLFPLLQNATNLDALIESRVQEILTLSDEPPSLLNFETTI
jgi:hypothetical protein